MDEAGSSGFLRVSDGGMAVGKGMVMFVKNMATVERKLREAGHLQEVLKEHFKFGKLSYS